MSWCFFELSAYLPSPLLAVSDPGGLSTHADFLVYVIKSDTTSLIRQAKNRLSQLQGFNALMITAWLKICDASIGLLDITRPHLQALCANDHLEE
jgi:hypothetical protein